ncbi:hypothetical protein M422DRAFT_274947, partial [Sphaerobolus stellatus SS14]
MLARSARSITASRSLQPSTWPLHYPQSQSPGPIAGREFVRHTHFQLLQRLAAKRSVEASNDVKVPSIQVPFAVRTAAWSLEQQIRDKEIEYLADTYTYFRDVFTRFKANTNDISSFGGLSLFSRPPEEILRDARILLSLSPNKDHAILHASLYDDILSLFQLSSVDSPVQLATSVLNDNLGQCDPIALSHIFDHICHLIEASPSERNTSAVAYLDVWFDRLAQAGNKESAELLCLWIFRLPYYFGVVPNRLHHRAVMKALLGASMPAEAWNWLEHMRYFSNVQGRISSAEASAADWLKRILGLNTSKMASQPIDAIWIKPVAEDYDIFFSYFSKQGDLEAAKKAIEEMSRGSGATVPTKQSWHMLIATLLAHSKSNVDTVRNFLGHMQLAGFSVSLDAVEIVSGRGPLENWVPSELLDLLTSLPVDRSE